MRELLRVASMRVDIRGFLGYGFGERLPVHQTISHAQTLRFVDAKLFDRLFLRSVALCREHGLIDGTHLSVDGFHVEADAALASQRASLALVEVEDEDVPAGTPRACADAPTRDGGGFDGGVSVRTRTQLVLAEPRSGPTPKRRSSNATPASQTDPDAKLRHKPGQRPHLVHRGQIAIDPKARCVVACLGETADGYDGDALVPILQRARFACPELVSVGAIRASPPSACGRASPSWASRRPCRPSARCWPPTARPRPALSTRRRPPGSAARPDTESGPTHVGWPMPRAASPSSRTSRACIGPAVAARACATSSYCLAAPR